MRMRNKGLLGLLAVGGIGYLIYKSSQAQAGGGQGQLPYNGSQQGGSQQGGSQYGSQQGGQPSYSQQGQTA